MLTTVWPAFRMLSNTDHGLDWAVWRDALTFEHVVYVRKNVDDDETLGLDGGALLAARISAGVSVTALASSEWECLGVSSRARERLCSRRRCFFSLTISSRTKEPQSTI